MQTLLLVDDEPNIVEGLASQFEGRYGGDVIVLKSFSGLHALSILQNNKVDVVLSDIRMPDMDGLTLQRETEALWPHIHFVFLSGFDDFQFIHQASKSPLYHGYLLKMEGDEVVLNKIDQEIAQCAAEARAELEQGEMQRRYARMQGFLQRAALEGFVRGGGSWQQIQHSLPNLEMTLDPTRPVAMVLGKDTAAEATEHLQSLMLADNILAAQFPQLVFESLMPESGTFVWLLQGAAPENPPATNYLYAVFEALQQQLSDTANCPVSVVVGNAGPFENLAEQYSLLNRIYRMVDQSAGRLLIVDENTYADLLLGTGSASIQNQFQFSALLQQLDQLMRTGTADTVCTMMQTIFFDAAEPPQLDSEQQLLLFTLLLNVRREIFAEQLGEEPARDTACFDLFNAYLRSGAATQLEMLHRFTDLCAETCRQREENETHSTQAIIKRINRYIEDNVENYDLSLTALARMTGFNPSYLSRFYRINTGKKLSDENRMRYEGGQYFVKSEEEMKGLFPYAWEAVENTQRIADRCHVEIEFGKTKLPHFDVPEGYDSWGYLNKLCTDGMKERYPEDDGTLQKRLEYELGIIKRMGYVDYFLIVWDFINYARENGIPVGPGRGSAAGSIVSYCLHITNIDPIRYSLLFERFLNPERVSMPDIDIDFCYERRQEVIDYVGRKYGKEKVVQIVTFGTLAAKGVIRDVGRVMDLPYSFVDSIAKMIPNELNMTIDKALSMNAELRKLYESDEQVHVLIDMSKRLEGLPRHTSMHAAGVVICPEAADHFVPLSQKF